MQHRFLVTALLFVVGAIASAMLVGFVAAFAGPADDAVQVLALWPSSAIRFGWWAWAVAGGLVVSLSHVVRTLARN